MKPTLREGLNQAKGNDSELKRRLMERRFKVDSDAIHFIAGGETKSGAHARNSIFKLSQRYKLIPDNEREIKIKQNLGKVAGEDELSGDEAWEPSYKRLPAVLKAKIKQKVDANSPGMSEHMLEEMKKIEDESSTMAETGIVTQISLNESLASTSATNATSDTAANLVEEMEEEELASPEFKMEMAKDFMKENLKGWFEDIRVAYVTGVKIVKVNALGNKFIRIISVTDTHLKIRQAHTKFEAGTDREVGLTEIEDVVLGKGAPSKEFSALEQLCKSAPDYSSPSPTVCVVILLPKGRTLSLIFLEEERRNAFAFFLRICIRRNREIAQELNDATI